MKRISHQEKDNPKNSISRVAKILTCLSEGKNTVSDVARCCKLAKATASRLLKALEKTNFVIRDGNRGKYYLGPLLSRIVSNQNIAHQFLIVSCLGEMNRMSEAYGETVGLGVLVGMKHLRLYSIPSRHNIRVYEDDNVNSVTQFQGAAIKVLLSQLDQKEIDLLMNVIKLEKSTDNSIVDKEEYVSQISQARKQGYAISRSELINGALAIAVPIKGYQFPAVLTILGVESRLAPKLNEVLAGAIAGATIISGNFPHHTNLK